VRRRVWYPPRKTSSIHRQFCPIPTYTRRKRPPQRSWPIK
jgi:hypothetical protein